MGHWLSGILATGQRRHSYRLLLQSTRTLLHRRNTLATLTDIADFWQSTLARLAREPIEAKIEDAREPLPYKNYRVTFQGLNGARITALLSLPIRGGAAPRKLPAIVTAPGYGGRQQGIMLDECQRGYAILQVFLRGPGNLLQGIEKPEGHYYQLAYADLIRAIDFLCAHEAIDSTRLAFAATSQGGGIALAVASLDPRIRAVAAHLPFLCHVRQAALIPTSLVARTLNEANRNHETSLQTLDYFDPLNLVGALKAPTLISTGGQDTTCPALGIEAVFNRIPGSKSLFQDPNLPHTTSEAFYHLTWTWLGRFLH